ncbi:MAG: chromosome condensation protein [Lachnospiraceae bacterium]|nr:chromosome condensation protein [Lachnospiraceae bacterium]
MQRELYPLNVGQLLQYDPIRRTGSQAYCNISLFFGLQVPLDFGLLKHAIQDEIKRAECLRIRFTAPDENGDIMQYIEPVDYRDIPFLDLSHLSLQEADQYLQDHSYKEFAEPDIPMVDFIMVSMPEGYNGVFIHIDHRLMDSSSLIVMIKDILDIYSHFRFGTPYPQPPASFLEVLKKDLKKAANTKRQEKDEQFWRSMLPAGGEPIYSDVQGLSVLQESRKAHGDKNLRAADMEKKDRSVGVADFMLEPGPTQEIIDFCSSHNVSMTNLLLLAMRTYLSKMNGGQQDITIRNYVSRRSTPAEWSCGGSRTLSFPCRTIITPDTEFLDAAYEVQSVQNRVYMHSNYDPLKIKQMLKEMYGAPEGTHYIGMSLTYQPMLLRMQNEHLKGVRMRHVWYPNGGSTKKIYLTVTHDAGHGGMIFDFHYQKATLSYHDMEQVYYYMMKIIFQGMNEPDMTIGEMIATI